MPAVTGGWLFLLLFFLFYFFKMTKNSDHKYPTVTWFNERILLDFPGGPVVKKLPAKAGDWVQSLVWKDSTRCGATKHIWQNSWAHTPQTLSSRTPDPTRRSHSLTHSRPHKPQPLSWCTPDPTRRSHSADVLQTPHAAATQPMHSRPHTPQLLTHALQTPHAAATCSRTPDPTRRSHSTDALQTPHTATTKPMHSRPHTSQPLSWCTLDPTCHNKRRHCNEKPTYCN